MNYIVFDLEWNQSPQGKEMSVERLPFEIVEIGAVKLNEKRENIGSFHEVVKPSVYKEINAITNEIIHLNIKELKNGRRFADVFKSFLRWCGEDYAFCTWGSMDLTELQRNMKYFGLSKLLKGPVYYFDVQKIFSIAYEDGRSRRNLEHVVDFLDIKKEIPFHRAFADAYYAAQIFRMIPLDQIHKNYSIDFFNNPKSKREEIYAVYETHSKFISREFRSKEDAMADSGVTSTVCYKCKKDTVRQIPWFAANARVYYCLSYCPEHGYMRGKIRIKKTTANKIFCVKKLKLVAEEEAIEIKERQEQIRKRRKEKRG